MESKFIHESCFIDHDVEIGDDHLSENSYALSDEAPLREIVQQDEPLVLDSSSETNRMKRQRITHESSNIKHYDNNHFS